jgi:phage I-like protein
MNTKGRFIYLDEDSGKFLDEQGEFNWIVLCREGDWPYDKARGHLKITEQTIDNFIKHFKDNVRLMNDEKGNPWIDIDYDHKEYSGKAAGWITDLRKSEKTLADGRKVKVLEGKPNWTPDAQAAIKKGEYRGFSIEFDDWKNPETGKLYKDVLFGGAITNRPYVKGMPPITLSEGKHAEISTKEERRMKLIKKVLAEIGQPVDGTDEYVDEKVAETIKTLSEKASGSETKLTEALKEADKAKKELADYKAEVSPKLDTLKEFEESEDARALAEVMKAANGKISPADAKNESHWFAKKLKEKKYAEILEILPSIKSFKDKSTVDDEEEGEEEGEAKGRTDSEKEHNGAIKYMQKHGMKDDISDPDFNAHYKAALEAVRAKNTQAPHG